MYALMVIIAAVLFVVFVFRFDSFAALFSNLGDIAAPVICGISIAYIVNPLVNFIENKVFKRLKYGKVPEQGIVMKKLHDSKVGDSVVVKTLEKRGPTVEKKRSKRRTLARALSIIISLLIVIAAIVGIMFAIVPSLAKSIVDLADKLPGYVDNLSAFLTTTFENNPEIGKFIQQEFSEIEKLMDKIADMVSPAATDLLGSISGGIVKFAVNVVVALKNVLIGFIIAIYLLLCKEKLLAQTKKIFFAFFSNNSCQKIFTAASKSNNILTKYIISNLLDSVIIFFFMAIGMLVMDMPYPLLLAVVCSVTNLIPFFGPFIGAIPCAILILMVDPIKVIWFCLFVLVLQQCDGNIIKPLLFGETMGLPPIWVLVSIILFGGMFGIVGMLLGAPMFAIIYLLFSEFVVEKLKKKNLPPETDRYAEDTSDFVDDYTEPEAEPVE